MGKFIDLTGMKRGKITVVEYLRSNNGSIWTCVCECGENLELSTKQINIRQNLMCRKCYRKTYSLEYGMGSAKQVFRNYENGAKKRNLDFNISFTFFLELTKKNCYYCGKEPSNIQRVRNRENGEYIYSGIDRINSLLGYTEINCIPCCWRCNEGKMAENQEDFKSWIEKVYNHCIKQNNNKSITLS